MITLAIPTYNRAEYVLESFSKVIGNDLITEICIVDDFSDYQIFERLQNIIRENQIADSNYRKVKIYRNDKNLGSFFNKLECVKMSNNNWIILLDSDNIIDNDYLDIVRDLKDENVIYAPSHAVSDSSLLNYTRYSGKVLSKAEYKDLVTGFDVAWDCILNTGNYFFNREKYIECIEKEDHLINSLASDVYYLLYLWFKNLDNSKFEIVKGLKYIHRLHGQSHYVNSPNSFDVLLSIKSFVRLWS
jgi:glycosyltransferase involved in cell wall biosynthesis